MKTSIVQSPVVGPTIAIIGGTHGNETCGVDLINYLQENLVLNKGKVILIPGNIRAIEKGVRQTEMNLNRAFLEDEKLSLKQKETYEYRRSREIMEILRDCDYCLDIHSSPTTGSPPMIICENNALNITKTFPINIRCINFDSIEPGSTGYFMNSKGKVGIGVECGNHLDPGAFDIAKKSAYALLRYLEMIDGGVKMYNQKTYKASHNYLTETDNFRIDRFFCDFEVVQKDQIIGYDGEKIVRASVNGYILFARDRKEKGVEGFVELTT